MTSTLILGMKEIEGLVSMKECIEVQEKAFRVLAEGRSQVAPNIWVMVGEHKGVVKILGGRAQLADEIDVVATKAITHYDENPRRYSLPNMLGVLILMDAKSSFPLAIMDGTSLTALRTGGGGGVATRYLARKDSELIGVLGSGVTASFTLRAVVEVLPQAKKVRVYSRRRENRERFARALSRELGLDIEPQEEPDEAVRGADLVITGTSSRAPVYKQEWLEPGLHINAMGSKYEIEPQVLRRCKVVGDELEVAKADGKCSVAIKAGVLRPDEIKADLGRIILRGEGREGEDEMTLFDSSGVAIQDVALAYYLYEKAMKEGVGAKVELVGEGSERYMI